MSPARDCVRRLQHGSVLIIVLWVAFGLVSIALYFAHSMSLEMRAADNRVANLAAQQAIDGAARYISSLLTNVPTPGTLPDRLAYRYDSVPVGDATYWILGRDTNSWQTGAPAQPFFGLVDESSKINLNTATLEMLEALPRMTPELAASIIDWRDTDSAPTGNGAESEIYMRLRPPYACKNLPFETVEELRLVYGATLDILFGEDTNLNGILDPNENDGTVSAPYDNRDGRLDAGLLDYVTVYSLQPNTRTNVNNRQQLAALLREQSFSAEQTNRIFAALAGPGGGQIASVLEFYIRTRMTAEEAHQLEPLITATNSPTIAGLINVNTASEIVLACIPGIGPDKASSVAAYRQSNSDQLNSVLWVYEALNRDAASARAAGPHITTQSYQFTADIAAVGHFGRGYRRTRFVMDTSEGTTKILFKQDLSHLGWALGKEIRTLMAKESRR